MLESEDRRVGGRPEETMGVAVCLMTQGDHRLAAAKEFCGWMVV